MTILTARGRRSDVALEDRGLREAGQPLAHAAGTGLADALHRLKVVDARREELLEAAEVVDQPVDDQTGQSWHAGQEPVATWAHGGVQVLAAGVAEGPRHGS